MAETKTASVGFLLGTLVLLCVWASSARATTEIQAAIPDIFTVQCISFAGETVRKDYGTFVMRSGGAQSALHPILQSFLFPEDPTVTRINCHFAYGVDSGAPRYQAFDVFATRDSCPVANPCVWYVADDGFYYGSGQGNLQYAFQWVPGMAPPSV